MSDQSIAGGGSAVDASHATPALTTTNKPCRYFATKSGCRAGNACPFRHDNAPSGVINHTNRAQKPEQTSTEPESAQQHSLPNRRRYQAPSVPSSKVVQRPVPTAQLEDPREFQLGQIRRRFAPSEKTEQNGCSFTFTLAPSDPDFPFEIESLECILSVPRDYPDGSRPKLRVLNKDIPRGFQINVEQGFDEIAAATPGATLLGLLNRLDKALADVLSRPMAETIKLYRPSGTTHKSDATPIEPPSKAKAPATPKPAAPVAPTWTETEKAEAAQKRQADIRQLVARLGKAPGFNQSSDGVSFTLPTTVFRNPNAPASITKASSLQLIVPQLYPLAHCRIQFAEPRSDELTNVEAAFQSKVQTQTQAPASLLAHVNYLSLNLKQMATAPKATVPPTPKEAPSGSQADVAPASKPTPNIPSSENTDKPHVHIIPRPLEWMQAQSDSEDTSDDSYSDESDMEAEETGDTPPADTVHTPRASVAEKGVLLSFPNLELHGIELLELTSLSLTVKCNRCKEQSDFERLRNNTNSDHTGMKEQGCKKCASSLAAGYRMDLIHMNSSRAGYIDLDGCTAVDMLPSTFVPTCSECSTAYTTPGCVSVRGDSTLAVCRECHRKMSFRIQEVKFLMVSAAAERATQGLIRKKVKENLGIVAGQELPRRGKCQHYGKSYRWFRFSCCSKVFPCDKCHDIANPDHVIEFANRMICGYCSREQNYRPEDCGVCHSTLIGKKGHGFWEGGKGTRDPARMSRKDPRKYKRRPGTKPKT
ncbi:hypothetical protein K461DRAFT_277699 [Myriangium duriaei CBS 260.36]|uniref:CHY-type domain-containing protein n=1 Tax=Myriangium duriaei CBS 260.36 TaxID=1168546 RepID=A0A9P4MFY0_9PEZI|nr:hypothetical protein K461DRAFT_277699 [Myriangium duriaei CBS 260.36]